MFWIVTAAAVIVLAALAWWGSGRSKPGAVPPGSPGSSVADDHTARSAGPRATKNII